MNQEERWLLEEKYGGVASKTFHADKDRLATGEPVAYLIGHVPFLGCQIYLDSHPLIPRPETEYWVEKAIGSIRMEGGSLRILDLCTGSGAIGVAVAKHCPDCLVTLSDITDAHNSTVNSTIMHNKIDKNHIKLVKGNLFENITEQYDFILTNPPYIDESLRRVAESVINHEPALALYGGKHGLDIINDIVKTSLKYLSADGQLWIEHEPEQSLAILEAGLNSGFREVVTHKDQYGVERFSVLMR